MARHLSEGRGRFTWEVSKFVLGWAIGVALLVFGGQALWGYLPTLADRVSPDTTVPGVAVTLAEPTSTTSPIAVVTTTTSTSTTSTTTTTTVPTAADASEVTVLVLNSTTRSGLAAGATADISTFGYLTEEPSNISPERTGIEIYYIAGLDLEAIALSDLLGESTLFLDTQGIVPEGVDLVVVLGSDYER
jgi:hypothetical protein